MRVLLLQPLLGAQIAIENNDRSAKVSSGGAGIFVPK